MGKRELLAMRKKAKIDGWKIGVESTCILIGGAIWNIRQDLDLTDDQCRQIMAAIQPAVKELENYCASNDTDELLERVEYVTQKALEMKTRMENGE